ncbi:hypothetical protein [Streptomyces goshikiensis]|uniref:hypothetical protein n=1 Tax=Streptomyces goshikiensis TaxID=1942 RepID=UPI00364F55E8
MKEAIKDTAIVVGRAQRAGTEPPYADGADVQRRGEMVCAAVVDGAGHHPDTVRYAALTPPVITHIGMELGGLPGLMTAGQMAAAYDRPPHASAVFACAEPGQPTSVHWIGDCRAYGWRESAGLTLWSDDQTMGQWLRATAVQRLSWTQSATTTGPGWGWRSPRRRRAGRCRSPKGRPAWCC